MLVLWKAFYWSSQNIPFIPAWHRFDVPYLSWIKPVQKIICLIGLLPVIAHRKILEAENLLPAPNANNDLDKRKKPKCPFAYRPDDGFGTDIANPTASAEGAPIGRNMPAVPKHMRNHNGGPDVQLVAQRLLAREEFTPAADQLNITAAAWIQAMVHDWIKHEDGAEMSLDKGSGSDKTPLPRFKFFETKERPDGHYNSERTMWWDASFLYGQNAEQVKDSRSGVGGKLKVDASNPDILPSRPDKTDLTGDNSNSWVGVTVLQIIFLKEHNYIADKIAAENPDLSDDEIYGYARNIIAALTAKIHTVDWTCELLKTEQLKIGMETNWYGITKAMVGKSFPLFNSLLRLIKKEKNENRGVPFCLTEEFAAVYRLHPLLPPGLVIEDAEKKPEKFVDLLDCVTGKGRQLMREPGMSKKVMNSIFHYPCGHLTPVNYPDGMRNVAPTDANGNDVQKAKKGDMNIDLAAVDLFRDRERGIQNYNDFRRMIKLKPFKTWEAMTGEKVKAKKLEAIYGPAPEGIEKCDLLVGDLYEKKIPGFALSETSFIIFLLMASRRLDADPYLNELYTEKYYTSFGLKHVEETSGLIDLMKRHYPDIADKFPKNQSAFKPIYDADRWAEKDVKATFSKHVENWNKVKNDNQAFFDGLKAKKTV
jgi:alpha-dioxygenase